MYFIILSISQTTYIFHNSKGQNMDKRQFKILIYILFTLFLTHCAAKKDNVEPEKATINSLQKKVDDLEYIIKSNSKGDEFVEQQFVYDNLETSVEDHNKTIKILKSKISYLEKELGKMNLHPASWENPFSIYNKKILMDNGTMYYGNIIYQDDYTITLETLVVVIWVE